MNKDSYTPCTKCGRPMRYCKGECCGKKPEGCDCREYGCKHNACIREKNPDCPYEAVIPSVTVETINNLKDLADCFVHVEDINTTFYIDDKHRIMVTWAGLVSADDYDFDTNPLNVRSQIIYDAKNNKAAIYDNKGAHYIFQISDIENDYMLLENKPAINGVTLEGNKTAAQLGILEAEETALVFDTVADMKASVKLENGGYARTLGFYYIGDGGGALYKIGDTGTANEMDIIAIGNLYANLVLPSIATPEMFGTYGDGVHDDTDYLKRCFAVAKNIKFGKDYVITNRIDVLSGTTLDGAYHTVTNNTAVNFFRANTQQGITIKNLNLIGDDTLSMAQNGINIISCSDVLVENVNIKDIGGDGVAFSLSHDCVLRNAVLDNNLISAFSYNSKYIIFQNVNVYKPRFQFGIQFKSCQHSTMENIVVDTSQDNSVYISKGAEDDAQDSFDITLNNITVLNQGAEGTQGTGTQYSIVIAGVEDCKLNNVYVKNGLQGIEIVNSPRATISNANISNCALGIRSLSDYVSILNCTVENCELYGIRVEDASYNIIRGCKVKDCGKDTSSGNIELQATDECVIDGNILEISSGSGLPRVNICTKTSIGKVVITNNNFINPAASASFYDIGTVFNVDKMVLANNGWIRLRNFQGISSSFPGVIDIHYGNIIVYQRQATTAPTYSGFKDGSVIYNGSGTGFIGWVINSGTWHEFGSISA